MTINKFHTHIIKFLESTHHLLLTVHAIRATQLHVMYHHVAIGADVRREKNRVVHAKSEEKPKEDDEVKKKKRIRGKERERQKRKKRNIAAGIRKRGDSCGERGRKTGLVLSTQQTLISH